MKKIIMSLAVVFGMSLTANTFAGIVNSNPTETISNEKEKGKKKDKKKANKKSCSEAEMKACSGADKSSAAQQAQPNAAPAAKGCCSGATQVKSCGGDKKAAN